MPTTQAVDLGSAVIIAVVVAGICRNRGWSSAIPLLIAGIAIGVAPFGPQGVADPETFLVLILAPLVFGEALTSSIVDLRRVKRPVMALAVGLVIVGAIAVGVVAQWVIPGIWTPMAFALGAILGPTDAVAVAATARKAALPRRLVNILEGESLVNDGTALTLLRVFSLAAAAGSVTAGEGALILTTSVLGGLFVGALGGLGLMLVVRGARDTTVANGLILVAPLPLYLAAETIEGSGILAVVVAGLVVAHASSNAVTYTGRLQATSLWLTITFILQAAAFFIVGLEMPRVLRSLPDDQVGILWVAIPMVFATLAVVRVVFVYLMSWVAGRTGQDRGWIVAAWAGTRGPISALAAFTLPLTTSAGDRIPFRELVISITFGVVFVSLLLAPTIGWLARLVGLPHDDDRATKRRVHVALARAALSRLEEIEESADRTGDAIPTEVLQRLRSAAEERLDLAAATAERQGAPGRHEPGVRQIAVEMMRSEQEELLRLRDREGLPDEIVREMQQEIDVRIRAIG
jgi:CPA1 family monovalent cation:H+ antiporter